MYLLILVKNPSESFDKLRTNGIGVEIVVQNPFMLSPSNHSYGFSAESFF